MFCYFVLSLVDAYFVCPQTQHCSYHFLGERRLAGCACSVQGMHLCNVHNYTGNTF